MRFASLLIGLTLPALASAQPPADPSTARPASTQAEKRWTGTVSLATYLFPDEDNILQPTATADRGALHLEARYNYEDTDSTSVFVGWNFAFGETVRFELTPMGGFVAGRTDGGIVGAKADLAWRRLEAYVEGEYVLPTDGKNRFLYSWSEFSVWATDWLRGGVAMQRTRTFRRFRAAREIEPAVLIGLSKSMFEGTFYIFNPGSDEKYFVVSIGVNF